MEVVVELKQTLFFYHTSDSANYVAEFPWRDGILWAHSIPNVKNR